MIVDEPPALPAVEPAKARCCSGCGHIALSYPLGHALPFRIERCGHCNSFWLDQGEWAALRQHGLHRQLHTLTNEPWQRQLRQAERRATWEAIYTARFGAEDYAEIQRVRAWLDAHPQRAMLLAFFTSPDPYQP
jgi:Zn-finger nucleic acid-binding protein